ncbi:MAG: formylglycine-generating enzyme family protein [Desulfuromonas sp.]|nr:MAG: formylglycine-generating enzyme family protein [Desulfuromonas sp.]
MKRCLSHSILPVATLFVLLALSTSPLIAAEKPATTHIEPQTGMEFVLVKGGCFDMGNTRGGGSYTEYPVHEVCVDDFYLGKTEVTQEQWEKLMGENPSYFKQGKDYPVDSVSRIDAFQYLAKLSAKEPRGFRLPTEAEWEFACRSGGKDEKFCGGDEVDELAWYKNNSGGTPHPVAQKKSNGLGLYDMSGNVWELCSDIFDRDYYKNSPKKNPIGATSGRHMMKRGGTWGINENFQRAATRGRGSMDEKHYSTGFRVAFTAQ